MANLRRALWRPRLFGETLVPVAHPRLAAGLNTLEDLRNHPLIEVSDHRKNWAQIFGLEVLAQETQVIQVDTTLAALSLAGAACGIALARPPASDELVARYGLVPCIAQASIPGVEEYYLVENSGARPSKDATTFKDWIVMETGNLSDHSHQG